MIQYKIQHKLSLSLVDYLMTIMEDAIVLYPSPGIGHLVSMVELGKLILKQNPTFSITILITTVTYETGSTAPYITTVSATNPTINFHYLPTITPSVDPSNRANINLLYFDIPRLNNPNLHEALVSISQSSSLKAFIIDFFCNAAMEVSKQLCIPTYYFFTSGACGLSVFLYTPTIDKNTTKSLKDLDTMFDDVPGVPPIHASEFPVIMLDRTEKPYEFNVETANTMAESSAGILINTFEMLESDTIKAMRDGRCVPGGRTPPLYCIGPLISAKTNDKNGLDIKGSDQGNKPECLSWLDSQPSRSVVFLSFGSMGLFKEEQLKEMAIGLEKSGVRFLWVVRKPPPADGGNTLANGGPPPSLDSFLPQGFLDRTKDRGYVLRDWAPQVDVLSHDSVGGFVTHCGWNSILESVSAGVPMLTWPLYAEQKVNRVALVEGMKVALRLKDSKDGFVSSTELEERVKELMDSEKGKAVRDRVMAFRDGAKVAMSEGGSSKIDLVKFIESLKQSELTQLSK